MVPETVGLEEGLNPHQMRVIKERGAHQTAMVYCLRCQRYEWVENLGRSYRFIECSDVVAREEAECLVRE